MDKKYGGDGGSLFVQWAVWCILLKVVRGNYTMLFAFLGLLHFGIGASFAIAYEILCHPAVGQNICQMRFMYIPVCVL